MDIQLEKKSLIRMLQETNDFEILSAIKEVFTAKKKDFWEELSEEQKADIEEADRQIDRGDFLSYADVMSKHF